MALTPKEIYDLNNMNVAAQNISLGSLLNSIMQTAKIGYDSTEQKYFCNNMTFEDALIAVSSYGLSAIVEDKSGTGYQSVSKVAPKLSDDIATCEIELTFFGSTILIWKYDGITDDSK